jgi:shikimate kinase
MSNSYLDEYIEEKMNLSVSALFERGIYFRKIEHESFVELLSSQESMIISLGGGTPCYAIIMNY